SPVPRPLSAARARRPRLLRSPRRRRPPGPGGSGPAIWPRRLLLLPLLVPRSPHPQHAIRRGPALGPAGLSVLSLLGERELAAPLGWSKRRDPDGADIQRGRRPRPHRLARPSFPGSALHSDRRAAALPRVQSPRPARPGPDHGALAGGG